MPHDLTRGIGPDIAVIGAGLMGRWHAATARRLGAHVVGIVDQDINRARNIARTHRTGAYPDLATLLRSTRPAVVHICTPLETHVAFSHTLLEAGCHVVCEKPLAASLREVRELIACAHRAGRRICPVHQFATQHGVLYTLNRLSEIGTLRRMSFTFYSAGAERLASPTLDATLLEILPHPLAVLVALRLPQRLSALDWRVECASPGDLLASASVAGVSILISVSLSARPTEASATISGTAGTIALDFFHGFAWLSRGKPSRVSKVLRPFVDSIKQFTSASANIAARVVSWEPAYPGLRTLLSRFYTSIATSSSAPFSDQEVIDIYDARDVLAQLLMRRLCGPSRTI